MDQPACSFCDLLRDRRDISVVDSDAHVVCFMDAFPVAPGHVLVVPRRHVTSIAELTTEEGRAFWAASQRLAARVLGGLAPAVNLHLSDGAEAEQDVPHVHMHVIPRSDDDRVVIDLPGRRASRGELDEVAAALRAAGRDRSPATGPVHHIELWVPSLERAATSWGWLLQELGYQPFREWPRGRSWSLGSMYVVIEESSAMTSDRHDRTRPGLNHLAFRAGDRARIDALVAAAPAHGWTLLFPDRHPHAGGRDHYAAYLHDTDGFEVELVADGA